MKPTTAIALAAVAALAGLYAVRKAKEAGASAIDYAAQKLDITSDQNLFYQGANKVVRAVSGDESATLGTWLYNVTHADENVITQPKSVAAGSKAVEKPDRISNLIAVDYDIMGNVIQTSPLYTGGATGSW